MDINRVPCLEPFTRINIVPDGGVYVCGCDAFRKKRFPAIGNIFHDTLDVIWNSPNAQRIRKLFYTDEYLQFCDPKVCPVLQCRETRSKQTGFITGLHSQDIGINAVRLRAPFRIVYVNTDLRCNLQCIMCHSWSCDKNYSETTRLAYERLSPHWRNIGLLSPCSYGEPLFVPEVRALLKSKTLRQNVVPLRIITNGTMFTQRLWDEISHNIFQGIVVSVDGIGEVYESIRRGAKWEQQLENLRLISRLRKEKLLRRVEVACIVMKRNLEQLKDMVLLARELEFDRIAFQIMHGDYPDNIFHHNDVKAQERLKEILQDPLFDDPVVDLWSVRSYS